MGVNGLQTYVEQHYPQKNTNLSAIAKQNSGIILVCDGNGLMYYLYRSSKLDWVHQGQYQEFSEYIVKFILNLRKNFIELHIFFDGLQQELKNSTALQRRNREVEDVKRVINVKGKGFTEMLIIPYLAKEVLIESLKKLNVLLFQSPFEADVEISSYCKKNHYFGVLGRDSDFYIFDVPTYVPFHSLFWDKDDILFAKLFSPSQIAQNFNITIELLPLMAALVGNDYTISHPKILHSLSIIK